MSTIFSDPRQLQDCELPSVVGQVFETAIGLPTAASDALLPQTPELLTAEICLTSNWKAAVRLHCFPGQARAFASRYLHSPQAAEDVSIATNTLGEITNLVAGHLKSVLFSGMEMSTPKITFGPSQAAGGNLTTQGFTSPDGSFWVSIAEA